MMMMMVKQKKRTKQMRNTKKVKKKPNSSIKNNYDILINNNTNHSNHINVHNKTNKEISGQVTTIMKNIDHKNPKPSKHHFDVVWLRKCKQPGYIEFAENPCFFCISASNRGTLNLQKTLVFCRRALVFANQGQNKTKWPPAKTTLLHKDSGFRDSNQLVHSNLHEIGPPQSLQAHEEVDHPKPLFWRRFEACVYMYLYIYIESEIKPLENVARNGFWEVETYSWGPQVGSISKCWIFQFFSGLSRVLLSECWIFQGWSAGSIWTCWIGFSAWSISKCWISRAFLQGPCQIAGFPRLFWAQYDEFSKVLSELQRTAWRSQASLQIHNWNRLPSQPRLAEGAKDCLKGLVQLK